MLKVSTTVVCIFVATASCLLIAADAWRVDCTKFVFAPKCRGISAKRASSSSIGNDDGLRTDPLDSVYMTDNIIDGGDPFTQDLETGSQLNSAPLRPLSTRKGATDPADMGQWIHTLSGDGRVRLASRLRQQEQQRRKEAYDAGQTRILKVLRELMRRYEENDNKDS